MKKLGEFETSDLSLAAYLSMEGCTISDVFPSSRDRKSMVFSGKKLDELVQKYYNGEARVDPLRYFNEIKLVKQRINHYGGSEY